MIQIIRQGNLKHLYLDLFVAIAGVYLKPTEKAINNVLHHIIHLFFRQIVLVVKLM